MLQVEHTLLLILIFSKYILNILNIQHSLCNVEFSKYELCFSDLYYLKV
jgi:hypothetical protein